MDKYINDMSGIQQNRYYLQKKLRISACYKSSGMRKSDVGLTPPDVSHCLRLQDLWQRDREEEVYTSLWNTGITHPGHVVMS